MSGVVKHSALIQLVDCVAISAHANRRLMKNQVAVYKTKLRNVDNMGCILNIKSHYIFKVILDSYIQ
jgi:hypothetical protein